MRTKILFLPLSLTITILLTFFPQEIHSELHNLTDSNFDSLVKNGDTKPWIIMFHVKNCARCVKSHEILQNYADHFTNFTEKINFGRVECNDNSFTCLRFDQLNITKMPNLIVIEKHRLFRYSGVFANETYLEEVINDERTVEKGRSVPPSIGYLGLFGRVFSEMLNLGDVIFEEMVLEYFGWKIEWRRAYTLTLFFGFLFV